MFFEVLLTIVVPSMQASKMNGNHEQVSIKPVGPGDNYSHMAQSASPRLN